MLSYITGSPTQKKKIGIYEFLTKYFEEHQSLEIKYWDFTNIILPDSKYEVEKPNNPDQIVKWLKDNTKTLLNDSPNTFILPANPITLNLNLITLDLSGVDFSHILSFDPLMQYFRINKTTENLFLERCNINDDKVEAFTKMLKVNQTIKVVSFKDNYILVDNLDYPQKVKKFLITNKGIKNLLEIENWRKNIEITVSQEKAGSRYINNIFNETEKASQLEYIQDANLNATLAFSKNKQIVGATETQKQILALTCNNYHEMVRKGEIKDIILSLGARGTGKTSSIFMINDVPLSSTNELKIKTKDEALNNKINEYSQRAKMLNNFPTNTPNLNIIECPGIGDKENVDIVKKISDMYAKELVFEFAKSLRFLITIKDNSLDSNFITLLNQFVQIFKTMPEEAWNKLCNAEKLSKNIMLIVTHVTQGEKDGNHIINELDKFLRVNSNIGFREKSIIESLKKTVHLFYKPDKEGKILKTFELKNFIEQESFKNFKEYLAPIEKIEDKYNGLAVALYQKTRDNIINICKIIEIFFERNEEDIRDPYKSTYKLDLHKELDSEMFTHYHPIVKALLPTEPEITHNHNIEADQALLKELGENIKSSKHFPALHQIVILKGVFRGLNKQDIKDELNLLVKCLKIIKSYYGYNTEEKVVNQFKDIIEDYIHVLERLTFSFKFFQRLSTEAEHDPLPVVSYSPITSIYSPVILKAADILSNILTFAIEDIKLKSGQNTEYYLEAINWLKGYKPIDGAIQPIINENLSKAHDYLGEIYNTNGIDYLNRKQFFDAKAKLTDAALEYILALKYQQKSPELFNKLGHLLCRIGKFYKDAEEYDHLEEVIFDALKYYQTTINTIKTNECFEFLKQVKYISKAKIYEAEGDFYLKSCDLPQKAHEAYKNAKSANKDPENNQNLDIKIRNAKITKHDSQESIAKSDNTLLTGESCDYSLLKIKGAKDFFTRTLELIREYFNLEIANENLEAHVEENIQNRDNENYPPPLRNIISEEEVQLIAHKITEVASLF